MNEQDEAEIRLAPLPKGYTRLVSRNTASSPGGLTRILPNGSVEYVTAIPKNAILRGKK